MISKEQFIALFKELHKKHLPDWNIRTGWHDPKDRYAMVAETGGFGDSYRLFANISPSQLYHDFSCDALKITTPSYLNGESVSIVVARQFLEQGFISAKQYVELVNNQEMAING